MARAGSDLFPLTGGCRRWPYMCMPHSDAGASTPEITRWGVNGPQSLPLPSRGITKAHGEISSGSTQLHRTNYSSSKTHETCSSRPFSSISISNRSKSAHTCPAIIGICSTAALLIHHGVLLGLGAHRVTLRSHSGLVQVEFNRHGPSRCPSRVDHRSIPPLQVTLISHHQKEPHSAFDKQ